MEEFLDESRVQRWGASASIKADVGERFLALVFLPSVGPPIGAPRGGGMGATGAYRGA